LSRELSKAISISLLLASGALAEERCSPDRPYYFSEFNPATWKVENEQNYEEVYKNYEYFEVLFSRTCDEIMVKKYVKGRFSAAERYRLSIDGSLDRIDSN
jgi:hypothetical protein